MRIFVLVALAIAVSTISTAPAGTAPNPAPAFELQLFNGQTFRLADHVGKNAVLVWFWAPW